MVCGYATDGTALEILCAIIHAMLPSPCKMEQAE